MREGREFSKEYIDIKTHAAYHEDFEQSLKLYFSVEASSFHLRFVGYEPAKVDEELGARLAELELTSTLTVLSAVEAAFRIDYLLRCDLKKKDPISVVFRATYKEKGARARLDEDIFDVWKIHTTGSSRLIGDLKAAFKFRNWLAHGRYWVHVGPKNDYTTIYALAASAMKSFPLLGS
jgi:hypothetical protein